MARLLVVEDESHLAQGIKFNLELEGYEVEVVGDGAEAFERLRQGPAWDLILLDVMLPGMDGFELVDRLRKAGDFTPTLMLTAKGLPEDMVHGLEAGADDYLAKPFDLSVLLARVKGLLRRRDWARGGDEGPQRARIGEVEVDFASFEVKAQGRHPAADPARGDAAEAARPERGPRRLQGGDPGEGLEPVARHADARRRQLHRAPAPLPRGRSARAEAPRDRARRRLSSEHGRAPEQARRESAS